jgi:hypothetical protein
MRPMMIMPFCFLYLSNYIYNFFFWCMDHLKVRMARQKGMEAVKLAAAGRKDDLIRMEREVCVMISSATLEVWLDPNGERGLCNDQ